MGALTALRARMQQLQEEELLVGESSPTLLGFGQ
jgi:hypothetical protein